LEPDERANYAYLDLCDLSGVEAYMIGVDYVFHLAGIKGSVEAVIRKPASFMVPGLMMNTNVLEAARLAGVKKLVYTSTIGAYGAAAVFREQDYSESKPPMDHYGGWSKRIAEMQIEAYRIEYGLENFAIVRPANVYGPGDSFKPESAMVIPSLMARIAAREMPLTIWGNGTAIRDFAFSRDVAEGIILALWHGTRDSFVNLGSGIGVTIRELAETLCRVTGVPYQFDKTRPTGYPKRVMDCTRARDWLGWQHSTSLVDGLSETWAWYQANRDEHQQRHDYLGAMK
jgi:GDP-L-fucose synthase